MAISVLVVLCQLFAKHSLIGDCPTAGCFLTHVQDNLSIYDTPSMKGSSDGSWQPFLQAAVLFLVLSPHTNHQQDMLFRVAEYKHLEGLPAYQVN